MDDGAVPERTLAAANEMLRIAPGFFGILDAEGRVVDANDASLTVIGARREDVVGCRFWECPWWSPLPASAAQIQAGFERALAGERVQFDVEFSAAVPGEPPHVRWVEFSAQPVHGAGEAPRVAVTGIDVTARKVAEQRLAIERNKLARIFRETPAAMALWHGTDLVFELVNPAYQAIFPDRQLVGRALLDAVPELTDQPFVDLLRHVLETGESYRAHEMLARLAGPDGRLEEQYYDFTYVRIENEGGDHSVYDHAVDVTDRVRARRELTDAVRELETERDLRDRLVTALSHDLRTPLSNARLGAELILRRAGAAGTPEHRAAMRIVNNVDRADRMIRDLLDANRLKAGERLPLAIEDVDATAVVRATIEEMAPGRGGRFIVRAPATLRGKWDASALQRIVENLVTNALKYGASDTPVTIVLEQTDASLCLRVHNEGNPIPAEAQETVFELFKRAPSHSARTVQGWGVGLSLVRGLATAHGGSVGVLSTPGTGTTFTVTLPLAPPA